MKKVLFIIIFIILALGIWQNVWAGKLLLKYPDIPGAGKLEEQSNVPELIRYIYLFSLGIVGFVALLSILIGAIRYTAAGANASQVEDAKEQIKQALLGVLILLAAVLILRTINPDLVALKFSPKEYKLISQEEPDQETSGTCQIKASWDREELNAGESATLTINWNKEDCKDKILKKFKLVIEHEHPNDWGQNCKEIKTISFPNNSPFVYTYTFNERCGGAKKGGCQGSSAFNPPMICNFRSNGPEIFYLEGELEIEGMLKQGIPRDAILVNDLDNDGNCCK